MYNRLIKAFEFEERRRSQITLDANVRLVGNEHKVELKADANGHYPTADNLKVKTWIANPTSAKGWTAFQCDIFHRKNENNDVVTSDGFRLGDGTNERWWDGAAWVVNTTNWNTELEVAANIAAFPIASQKLQVVVKLRTADRRFTPTLTAVRVAYLTDIESQEDILYRTIVPTLRDNVRPTTDYQIQVAASGTTLDLASTYKLETPYKVVGVAAAYNLTTDPNNLNNIFQSYDANTKVVTLSASVTGGQVVLLRLIYEPVVAVMASQEFNEVYKVPCIVIEDFSLRGNDIAAREAVVNKATGAAVVVSNPYQADVEFALQIITDKGVDHQRLADALKRLPATQPLFKSKALDEDFTFQLLGEFQSANVPNRAGLHASRLRARLVGALFFVRDAADKTAVLGLNRTYPTAP